MKLFYQLRNVCVLILVGLSVFVSCDEKSKTENNISKIEIDFTIERFDEAFANTSQENLSKLKETFPFFFNDRIPDSVWVNKLSDTLQLQMFKEAKSAFNNLSNLELDLLNLFQHIKYYDKTFNVPRVITIADNVDYRTKSIVNDELVIINLLNYLGSEHEFYQNIAQYIADTMIPEQIIPDIANAYAEMYVFQNKRKTFLEEMIYFGKLLYFKDVMIPEFTDTQKIGYTSQDIDWIKANETQVWSYFVENELLFSSDNKLLSRFITPAPFSKFYLQIDNESPGAIGRYIGWQIVKAYAERTSENILDIMQTDADVIFNKSKYKPKR